MWAYYHRDEFADLDLLEIPTIVGRRLDVGGFVFTDPFDVFLRKLSEQYLSEAWSQLVFYLEQYHVDPQDLSWGVPHPGETGIPGIETSEPHHFIGWTSQKLARFYEEDKFSLLDEILSRQTPQLRCIATWRSLKWDIAPTNFRLALRLIEAICTEAEWCWNPTYALSTHKETNYSWLKVVKAINEENQEQLNLALQEAKAEYSALGYRIVMHSIAYLIQHGMENSMLQLPDDN